MERRLVNLLGVLGLAVSDRVRPAVEGVLGQRGAAVAALVHLSGHPAESVEQVSTVLGISQPGAVAVVGRLVADGLLERRPGADRRTHALHPTELGRAALQRVLDARAEVLADLLAPLDAAERDRLTPLLEKVVAGLAADRPRARTTCRLCDRLACTVRGCPLDHTVPGVAAPAADGDTSPG